MHVLLSQNSNCIQALAKCKQLLSNQKDVFTFVLGNPMLLGELNDCEYGVFDLFGHPEHFTKSQVQVKNFSLHVLAQLSVPLINGSPQRISEGRV